MLDRVIANLLEHDSCKTNDVKAVFWKTSYHPLPIFSLKIENGLLGLAMFL